MANQQLPVNNQTQAVLSKYGITAPKKITNIQKIQNKTETDIKIVQPDIKISQPNIKINPVEQAAARYKDWVNSAYSRQKSLLDKQRDDFREKEYSLNKGINQVFRKIDDLSKQIIEKGRNFKRKLDSTLAPLVITYISMLLPVIWRPLMDRINSIEHGFRYLFFGEIPPGERYDENSFSFIRSIRQFLGMDDSEGKGLFGGIGELISEGIGKVIEHLKIIKDDRVAAVTEASKGDPGWGSWESIFSIKENFGKSFNYIGDILTAAISGSKAMGDRLSKRDATNDIEEDTSKKKGKWGSGKLIKKALESKTPASSYYLSDQAVKFINKKGTIEVQKLQFLFNEINKLAENDEAIVSENFLNTFLGKEKIQELQKSGKITQQNISYDHRNKKDDDTIEFLNESYKNDVFKSSDRSRPNGYGSRDTSSSSKNATIAYKIDKSVIQELFSGINSDADLYDQKNYSVFRSSIQNFHKNIHKEDSEKAKLKEGSNKFYEINEQTQKRLANLEIKEEYRHWNNSGNTEVFRNPQPLPIVNIKKEEEINSSEIPDKVVDQAKKDIGKITYNYGGSGYYNTDCSGYISNIYNKFGVNVPKGTLNIYDDAMKDKKAHWVDFNYDTDSTFRKGKTLPNWDNLRPGDIMVWSRYGSKYANNRGKSRYAGHVSLYTGEVDKDGVPIILGHGGPGPGPNEKKGTKREGYNDYRSYLGAVRYDIDISKNIPSSTIKEKDDAGEDDKGKEETTPTVIPTASSSIPQKEVTPTKIEVIKDTPITPNTPMDISIKTEEDKITSNTDNKSSNNITDNKDLLEKINDNINASIENCKTSVTFKQKHAEEML